MKPVLIYAMPRSRASVCMTTCKRRHQYDEPFRVDWQFLPPIQKKWDEDRTSVIDAWSPKVRAFNDPDSCVKIHGLELRNPMGHYWYEGVLKHRSHEIYVVDRVDRLQMSVSYILASEHDVWEEGQGDESTRKQITVTDDMISGYENHIIWYLSEFPYYGEIITYETAPSSRFNRELATKQDQHSSLKYHYITNLDWCTKQLHKLLDKYRIEWDTKMNEIKPN